MKMKTWARMWTTWLTWVLELALAGLVLWVFDEGFGWDVLPDWLETIAGTLLAAGAIVAFCLAVLSVTSSLAALVESREGASASGRARWLTWAPVIVVVLLAVAGGTFHGIDKVRSKKAEAARREEHKADYEAERAALEGYVATLGDAVAEEWARTGRQVATNAVAGSCEERAGMRTFMEAVAASAPVSASVRLVWPGTAPYAWNTLNIVPSWNCRPGWDCPDNGLSSMSYLPLPKQWERDTVAALFRGEELRGPVPPGRHGLLINTENPNAWVAVRGPEGVEALLILCAPVQRGYARKHRP